MKNWTCVECGKSDTDYPDTLVRGEPVCSRECRVARMRYWKVNHPGKWMWEPRGATWPKAREEVTT